MKIASTPHRFDLSYGIEEEFFVVDRATRDLAANAPASFLRACRLALATYRSERNRCRSREEALGGVVDWLIGTTASSQNDRPAVLPGAAQPVDDTVVA